MSRSSGRIADVFGRGGGGETERLRAQVDRARSELAGLADMLGETFDGDRIARRAEIARDRTTEEVTRRARQAADTAREHPVGAGFAVVVLVGLLALLFSRR